MKRFTTPLVILFCAVLSSKCDQPYIFYYFNQKIILKRVYTYIPVKFNEGTVFTNTDILRSSFGNTAEYIYDFTSSLQDNTLSKTYIVKVRDNAPLDNIRSSINELLNFPNVENAGIALRWNDRVIHLMTNEIIVKFKKNATSFEIDNLNRLYKAKIIEKINNFENVYLLGIQSRGEDGQDNAIDVSAKYNLTPLVDFAQPNFIRLGLLLQVPNDTMLPHMWNIKNTGNNLPPGVNGVPGCDLNMDSAWTFITGNPQVLVGIVDTGTDTTHYDLRGNLCSRDLWYDPLYEDGNIQDCNSHGTAMCGIAGAIGNNVAGIAGIAWKCKIMPIRVFDCVGNTSDLILAKGLDWGWRHGASVLSNSWGGGIPTPFVSHSIQNAVHFGRNGKGTVVFAATGNDDTGLVLYPSSMPEVIAVGGLSPCNQRKSKTSCDGQNDWGANYGENLSIVSPTPFIGCTTIYDGWSIGCNGTSSSCPQAAAIGALVLAKNIYLTGDSVRMAIEQGARKIGNYSYNIQKPNGLWNNEMGYGRIDAMRSLALTPRGPDSIYDQTPPIISFSAPQSEYLKDVVSFTANITDNEKVASGMNLPRLYYYTTENRTIKIFEGIPLSDNNYTFTLPKVVYEAKIYYYIAAQDASSNRNITTYPLGGGGINPPGTIPPPRYMFLQNTNYTDTSFYSTDVPKIVDPEHEVTLLSNLSCPISKSVLKLKCLIIIEHDWVQDLSVSLTSPAGTEIVLTTGVGYGQSNYLNTVFDDYAEKSITDTSNRGPYTGSFRPIESLWLLNGENSYGQWHLKVVDNGRGVHGSLLYWKLFFRFSDREEIASPPMAYQLVENYPNPFNSSTRIVFNLPQAAKTKIVIHDVLGRQVTTILDEYREAQYRDYIDFNANDVLVNDGRGLASGVYFYSLYIFDNLIDTRKMVLLK
jgi:subtilisin family serine protease/subtilisin-like proprotein convertase family protein